jgi:cupin fold WbuC family metalloprotein
MAESVAMKLKTVTDTLLAELVLKAQASPRRRANFNLHPELDDPVQRFLNAVEPGTYVRPHRHVTPAPKWELFVALAGRIAILVFDDAGTVTERIEVAAAGPVRAVEIPAGAWHGLVVLDPGTVLFEFKQGPYAATSDKDFAAWAPAEGEAACQAMRERFEAARIGDACA